MWKIDITYNNCFYNNIDGWSNYRILSSLRQDSSGSILLSSAKSSRGMRKKHENVSWFTLCYVFLACGHNMKWKEFNFKELSAEEFLIEETLEMKLGTNESSSNDIDMYVHSRYYSLLF